ncbi:ribosomal protein L6 [Histoplasma capsulatum var. duboisii H88]|uniref:Ribosomal protein L6 n=1 Tax=Ajellomyces capsulatus (strain H88) TaxID=544711 RepID=F0UTV0_AJEC8|nr:ribosomal protein L6 [Histoplasma capsulatum var. duboisii H88]QSS57844.1 ribosomal protein L6 [Histoplasma capsulatum var. duboisii H88]
MNGIIPRSCYRQLLNDPVRSNSLPAFLLPAFSLPLRRQPFSVSTPTQSRVGSAPLSVPSEVSLKFIALPKVKNITARQGKDNPTTAMEVTGPLGTMTLTLPSFSTVNFDQELRKATVEVQDAEVTHQRAMWGTIRQHLKNYILGVSEGHTCILKLVGVGFRAMIEPKAVTVPEPDYPGQQYVSLKVGYAHPIELGIPLGVKASMPQPTTILLEGINKEVVTQFAAEIRAWRKPEPYKGKGIFVNGETIRLKAKKIK